MIPRGPYECRWAPCIRSHGSGQGQHPCGSYRPPGHFAPDEPRSASTCKGETAKNPGLPLVLNCGSTCWRSSRRADRDDRALRAGFRTPVTQLPVLRMPSSGSAAASVMRDSNDLGFGSRPSSSSSTSARASNSSSARIKAAIRHRALAPAPQACQSGNWRPAQAAEPRFHRR